MTQLAARERILRPHRAAPADAVRATGAEINLSALRHNLRSLRRHTGRARVWAVLKADGYGHGAPMVARTLERAGVDGFCVALLEEGIELRDAGVRAPILVMGGCYGGAHAEVLAHDLVPVVYDLSHVESFARLVRTGAAAGPIDVHVKIDTGMGRLGVTMRDLARFAAGLADYPEVRVRGLMTHFAHSDAPTTEETFEQALRFDEATALLVRHGVRATVRHAANSASVLREDTLLDAVRPGIALFGVSPTVDGVALSNELRAVMRVRTEVVAVREIEAGESVGYGGLWRAPRASRIATVAMGYGDGLSRQLSNRGHMLVRGKRAPIVGAISMDMSMVDVTDVPGVGVRDEVVTLGSQSGPLGQDAITPDEIAAHCRTIAWEVLTSISRRVPRYYREP